MPKSYDIVAWTFDGAIYCPGCKPDPEAQPVFEQDVNEVANSVCDTCGEII